MVKKIYIGADIDSGGAFIRSQVKDSARWWKNERNSIDKQFDCMAKYLSWDMLFKKSYYATARGELEKNKDSMNELEGIGKNL